MVIFKLRKMKRDRDGILMFLELAYLFTSAMTAKSGSERINEGGFDANITEAPWTVALMEQWKSYSYSAPEDLKPFCTGSIIDAEWILTAASCVLQYRSNPDKMVVIAGIDDAVDLSDESLLDTIIQTRTAKRIHYHPNYQPEVTGTCDTALVYVDPFNFTIRVQPVELWNDKWPGVGALAACRAFGWGVTSNHYSQSQDEPHVLRKVDISAQHGKCDCINKRIAQRRTLCSHPLSAGGLCDGDSGGPLICDRKLTGVASRILRRDCSLDLIPSIPCDSPSSMSLWVYVCPMLKFINHHIPTAPVQPENCSSVRFVANLGFIILSAILFLRS